MPKDLNTRIFGSLKLPFNLLEFVKIIKKTTQPMLLDYDDFLSKSNDEEKFGSPMCIKDKDGELIDKGSTVLSGKSYYVNNENVNSDLSRKLYVFIDRPKFLMPGEFKSNVTFSAAVESRSNE